MASIPPTTLLSISLHNHLNIFKALIFSHPPWQGCHVLYSSADQTLWKQPLKPVLQCSVWCACQIRMPEFCFGMKIYISNSCILVCWGWPTTACGLRVWLAVLWPSPHITPRLIFFFFCFSFRHNLSVFWCVICVRHERRYLNLSLASAKLSETK